jgi:hypothetical protein
MLVLRCVQCESCSGASCNKSEFSAIDKLQSTCDGRGVDSGLCILGVVRVRSGVRWLIQPFTRSCDKQIRAWRQTDLHRRGCPHRQNAQGQSHLLHPYHRQGQPPTIRDSVVWVLRRRQFHLSTKSRGALISITGNAEAPRLTGILSRHRYWRFFGTLQGRQ